MHASKDWCDGESEKILTFEGDLNKAIVPKLLADQIAASQCYFSVSQAIISSAPGRGIISKNILACIHKIYEDIEMLDIFGWTSTDIPPCKMMRIIIICMHRPPTGRKLPKSMIFSWVAFNLGSDLGMLQLSKLFFKTIIVLDDDYSNQN
jgi:hypothetical protein